MKKQWRETTAAKAIPAIFAILFLWVTACCGLCTLLCLDNGYYSDEVTDHLQLLLDHTDYSQILQYYTAVRQRQLPQEENDKNAFYEEQTIALYQDAFDPERTNLRFHVTDTAGNSLLTNDPEELDSDREVLVMYSVNRRVDIASKDYTRSVHFTDYQNLVETRIPDCLEDPDDYVNWFFTDDLVDHAYHYGFDVEIQRDEGVRETRIFSSRAEAEAYDYTSEYGNCRWEILTPTTTTAPAEDSVAHTSLTDAAGSVVPMPIGTTQQVDADTPDDYIVVLITIYNTQHTEMLLAEYFAMKEENAQVIIVDSELEKRLSNGLDITINARENIAEEIAVRTYLPADLPVQDIIREDYEMLQVLWQYREWFVVGMFGFAVLTVIACIVLCTASGHTEGRERITASSFHRIAYEFFYLLPVLILLGAAVIISIMRKAAIAWRITCLFGAGLTLCMAGACILWLYTTAIRAKNGTFWSSFGIVRLLSLLLTLLQGRIIISMSVVIGAVALLCLNVGGLPNADPELDLLIAGVDIAVLVVLLYAIHSFFVLKDRVKRIEGGDYTTVPPKLPLVSDFGEFSRSLDHMTDSIAETVAQQTKAERMRTELITNVSHDLKTPLTSIVNYIDLLAREPMQTEHAAEYLEVLQRQSARLKKLTEDLVEASKASTGNLTVDLQPTDIQVLLLQLAGEYEDRFAQRGLTLVTELPERPLPILADGRHIWRVFDNLLGNACKYSMPSTRIYLDATAENGIVRILLKNVSEHPLNLSPDELTERFVRGDVSRHTEGSGLGLSIAKDLMRLQGGTLTLQIDGDLFKAIVTFPAYYPPAPDPLP